MPGPPPVGPVVHPAVGSFAVLAQIPQAHLHLAGLEGAARHTGFQQRGKKLRKQGDDVKTHGLAQGPVQ